MNRKTNTFITIVLCLASILELHAQELALRLMSFNIQQPYGTDWDSRKANGASIINTTQADVIGTQEAVNYQRDYLIQQTGYKWFGTGRDGGDAGEGSWIFYKGDKYTIDVNNSGSFWMSATPTVPSAFAGSYNRICTYVRLVEKTTGQGFYMFNAHFPTPDLSDARLKSMKLLASRMSARAVQTDPVYLTGDFNSTEGDAVTIWMKSGSDNSMQCRDTYRDFDPAGQVSTGFGTKFDYIYCPKSTSYSTQTSWVVKTPAASDHMPIVAEVKYGLPIAVPQAIPGKIEAESYFTSFGVELENTTDTGGGKNVGFLDPADWMKYKVNVAETRLYNLAIRFASLEAGGKINILVDNQVIKTLEFDVTQGWQNWQTTNVSIDLEAGIHELKIEVLAPGFNINWLDFTPKIVSGTDAEMQRDKISFLPNPAKDYIKFTHSAAWEIYSLDGVLVLNGSALVGDLSSLLSGVYVVCFDGQKKRLLVQ